MRQNSASSVYRSCLGVVIGAGSVALGAGLGIGDVPDPAAALILIAASLLFIIALVWILA